MRPAILSTRFWPHYRVFKGISLVSLAFLKDAALLPLFSCADSLTSVKHSTCGPSSALLVLQLLAQLIPCTSFFLSLSPPPSIGLPIHHSRRGAENVIFLDFDGHEQNSETYWGAFSAKPYDLDGDAAAFSDYEQDEISLVWARVTEDYAPFDVDVTTEEPPEFNNTVMRALVTSSYQVGGEPMPYHLSGGVAYVGVFGEDILQKAQPALIYYDNLVRRSDFVAGTSFGESTKTRWLWGRAMIVELNICRAFLILYSRFYVSVTDVRFLSFFASLEATSHELGHCLSLSHDGQGGSAYYQGSRDVSDPTSWGPSKWHLTQ